MKDKRLEQNKAKLETNYNKLKAKIDAPNYAEKVPEKIRKEETEKIINVTEIEEDSKVKRIRLIGYFATIIIFTVLICFRSILIGLVYLLGAFIIKMIIPWVFDNFGAGGTKIVNIRKDTVSRLVARVFVLIILMLAVWQLSYGALWEIEFLTIIAIAMGSTEVMFAQNRC